MIKNLLFTSVLLFQLLFLGCSHVISKEDCEKWDFYAAGRTEGVQGLDQSPFLNQFTKECVQQGVRLDQSSYEKGYFEGLKTFCSYEKGLADAKQAIEPRRRCVADSNYQKGREAGQKFLCTYEGGVELGRMGKREDLQSLCPSAKLDVFVKGYTLGLTDHLQSRTIKLDERESQLNHKESLLKKLEHELSLRSRSLSNTQSMLENKCRELGLACVF